MAVNKEDIVSSYTAGLNPFSQAYRDAVRQEQADKLAATSDKQAIKDLEKATRNWTLPLVMRSYDSNAKGERQFASESVLFTEHGYDASNLSEQGGHLHAGRLLLTGGLSIFAGKRGIRAGGKRTVTWKKLPTTS